MFKKGKSNIEVFNVAQALSVWHYPELEKWCEHQEFHLNGASLKKPDYLSFSVIPPEIRRQILDMYNTLDNHSNHTKSIIKELQSSQFDKKLFDKFQRYINWYDPSLNLLTHSPIWQNIIA